MNIKFLFCIICFFVVSFTVDAKITEIMYNPPGNDNNLEYIEVVFGSPKSMNGWIVEDLTYQDVLVLVNGSSSSSINIIVEEGYSGGYFSGINLSNVGIYSAGAAIGNGLGNDGDVVYLYDVEGNLTESVEYNGSIANGDGNAVCINGNNEHYSCEPNPGEENGDTQDPEVDISINLPSANTSKYAKEAKESDSYARIDYIENPPIRGCKYLTVYVSLFNSKKVAHEVRAYVQEINVITKLNVNGGEKIEIGLPVATCNNTIDVERGEYVVVVEGFEEKDMKLVYLSGLGYQCSEQRKEQSIRLKNSATESHINSAPEIKIEKKRSVETLNAGGFMLKEVGFYLAYAVGSLSVYYVLFKR